jgi:oligosaccharide translocation protein RFT1
VILISYLASLQAQGIYALASNYGGLVARMVLQPIEESSRNYFGKLLSSINGNPSDTAVKSASKDLHNLFRVYVLLSICVVSLGPKIAPLLLDLVAGSRWASSGAGDVLAKYCYYIPLLAVNGVAEAFVSSVATESELNRQSAWMFVFSLGFAVSGYIFLRVLDLGAEGLVWANAINMAFRIVWSFNFIDNYLRSKECRLAPREMMPQLSTVGLSVGTIAALDSIQASFKGKLEDLIKSGIVSLLFIILM